MTEKPKASQPLRFEPPASQPAPEIPEIQLNLDTKESRAPSPAKGISTRSKPTAEKKGKGGQKGGKSKQNPTVILVSAASAIALLLVGMLLIFGAGRQGAVVIRWKTSERESAAMRVDGRSHKVPTSESFTLSLPPGRHDIDFKRDGYFDISHSMNLEAGERTTIDVIKWRPSPVSNRRR